MVHHHAQRCLNVTRREGAAHWPARLVPPEHAGTSEREAIQTIQIIVAGQARTLCDLLTRNLRQRGFKVETDPGLLVDPTEGINHPLAQPGGSASGEPFSTARVPVARPASPDVLICDVSVPEPACWAAAARVRAAYTTTVPIILLGDAWPDQRRLAELQPCIYLGKPVAISELLQAFAYASALMRRGSVPPPGRADDSQPPVR